MKRVGFLGLVVLVVGTAYLLYNGGAARGQRLLRFRSWYRDPAAHPEWAIRAGETCGGAPFQAPTDGYIGFIWGDSFRPGHRHQGIDIFGGEPPGETPVYAAYPGYLTRMPDWVSSVIVRVPDNPLDPGNPIWTYYTHMANRDGVSYILPRFPPGTYELEVQAGDLLGFQGDYSGDPNNPVGVHLHFSIVQDDGEGGFKNELNIRNTLDPSAYLGLPLNASQNSGEVPVCPGDR